MNRILKQITKEDVLVAIDHLKKFGWNPRRNSKDYDLLYGESAYPPKEIIRYAGEHATGEEPIEFGGGSESNNLLIRLGFMIVHKGTHMPIEVSQSPITHPFKKELEDELQKIEKILEEVPLLETEKEQLVKIRIGQGVFRKALLTYHSTCALCSVSNPQLLIASHIKPWKDCTSAERLDMENGLLLCPNHDRLFDKGYLTFDDDGDIILSSKLSTMDRRFMNVVESMRIGCLSRRQEYLKWHKLHVFSE